MRTEKFRKLAGICLMAACMAAGSGLAWANESTQEPYSDRDLVVATQIAYYDFTQEQLEQSGGSATVAELLGKTNTRRNLESKWNNAEKTLEKEMYRSGIELYDEITASGSRYASWKVLDIRDTNEENGFYGLLLDTGSDCAILAFRGSESTDTNQLINDWLNADFGLLMDHDTTQQKVAAAYLADVDAKYGYARYAITGHSLGGNLAEHAAITAPDSIRAKLVETVNFDGSGFSQTYLERHKEEIKKVQVPVRLCRWSLVGALLSHASCTSDRVVQVNSAIQPLSNKESNYLRHSTAFLVYDKNQLVDGTEDLTAAAMRASSRRIDQEVVKARNAKKNQETKE